MPPFRCRSCGRVQRLTIFEGACKNCGGTDLEPTGGPTEDLSV